MDREKNYADINKKHASWFQAPTYAMGLALSSLYWCVIPETPSKDGETNGLRSRGMNGCQWLQLHHGGS